MSDDCRLILGDCLDAIGGMQDASLDALICDPPYGVGLGIAKDMRGGKHGLAKAAYAGSGDTYEEFVADIVPRLDASLAKVKRGAVFTGPHIREQAKASAMGGIYCSAGAGRHCWGFKTFLPILFYGKDHRLHRGARPIVLASNARAEKNGHPCPKPLEWMVWLVERVTAPGETVFDPFMGSGTTGVACVMTGRKFVGVERDPAYFAIAERRIAAARSSTPLLAPR